MELKVGQPVNVTLYVCGMETRMTDEGEKHIYDLCYKGDLKKTMRYTLKIKDTELEEIICK